MVTLPPATPAALNATMYSGMLGRWIPSVCEVAPTRGGARENSALGTRHVLNREAISVVGAPLNSRASAV